MTAIPEPQQKTILIGIIVGSSLLVIALIVIIIVLCLKKKQEGKVGASDTSLQGRFKDMETNSTEEDKSKKEDDSGKGSKLFLENSPAPSNRSHLQAIVDSSPRAPSPSRKFVTTQIHSN